jgi:hypothetical protein
MLGDDCKKSLHHPAAGFLSVDEELLENAQRLREHFQLEMLAVDYMVGRDGGKHLLEVNHIPNVTIFPEIREAYLSWAAHWVKGA